MGTWWGFTPYIGAGAGIVQLKTRPFVDGVQLGSSGKTVNLAWAAMAGVSYQVSQQFLIDVGYRYLSFGNTSQPDGSGAVDLAPLFKNLTAQEARIGPRIRQKFPLVMFQVIVSSWILPRTVFT